MTDWVWTWCGVCFGYREQDNLWTYDGRHVGRYFGTKIHAADGRYIGEVWRGRLVTDPENHSVRQPGFVSEERRRPRERYTGFEGPPIPYGLTEFPAPEEVR